ncbi:hypothetical protein CTAYLR_009522 [Chrysophaeum taylorii]|uniref:Uncharacterized protein n=1 Tax=Chrysophaeum taylorii TaxID=2483200 RepID=A0AAD7UK02_9STRA|nr:hypothetical protein CTAYLR_009522 [Chrysophaeum taylorii]
MGVEDGKDVPRLNTIDYDSAMNTYSIKKSQELKAFLGSEIKPAALVMVIVWFGGTLSSAAGTSAASHSRASLTTGADSATSQKTDLKAGKNYKVEFAASRRANGTARPESVALSLDSHGSKPKRNTETSCWVMLRSLDDAPLEPPAEMTETAEAADTGYVNTSVSNVVIDVLNTVAIAGAGLTVIFGAARLIAGAYEGEKGLGAFLRDGDGFANSGYKVEDTMLEPRRITPPRFIDKVRFPTLDFVQVYSGLDVAMEEAETLRAEIFDALKQGDLDRANKLETRLQKLMRDNGIVYEEDDPVRKNAPP